MITVLVAAYQGETYLEEQLDSILNQTLTDLQVFISDDGSTDGTWELARQYAARYPGRVHCMRHPRDVVAVDENLRDESLEDESLKDKNLEDKMSGDKSRPNGNTSDGEVFWEAGRLNPAAANFFWLLSRAEGDYIMLSDQDDVWREDKAECLLFHMKKAEKQWGKDTPVLLYSDARVVDRELKEIAPSFLKYQHISPSRTSLNEILVENPVTGGAMMFNAALLPYISKAPRQCVMHDWWIALTASCFGHITCVKEPLYSYRQHGSNTLGARRTGSLEDLKERMNRGGLVKERYDQMFTQASCFLERFGPSLTKRQREVLRAYLSLPYQRLRGRMKTVRRYHFHKSSRIQTVAQCFTIPRR